MSSIHYYVYGILGILLVGISSQCTDPVADNLFDPGQSFIRFNYENQVTDPAKDQVILDRQAVGYSLTLPLALSAPGQTTPVRIALEWSGLADTTYRVLDENGLLLSSPASITLDPGDFDHHLRISLLATLPMQDSLQLSITATEPMFLLGFPGSGRGRQFTIIYQ